jgi:multicomponent Na+:H+ antiporter subunit B
MIRKFLYFLILLAFGFFIYAVISAYFPFGENTLTGVAKYYVDNGVKDLGGINIITSIVTVYRGFDTLGEVTVLFLSVTALAFTLLGFKVERRTLPDPTLIVETGGRYLAPLIMLLGAYIFLHGHLTPGGGFPGGVIIATAFLLLLITQKVYKLRKIHLTVTEALAGSLYVVVGLVGLYYVRSFLGNFLQTGKPGYIVSAGIIPIIYLLIGFKVGSEMTVALKNLKEGGDEH